MGPSHFRDGVFGEGSIARLVLGAGEGSGAPDAPVIPRNEGSPGGAAEWGPESRSDERRAEKAQDFGPAPW